MTCRTVAQIALIVVGTTVRGQDVPAPASLPTRDSAEARVLGRILKDTTLANGLEIISVENHTVPLATIEVVVHTGSYTQDSGTEGVPHLFEHMLFRSFSGANDASFAQTASELDGIYNGTTQYEDVSYFVTLPSAFVDQAMEMMSQLVRDPVFTQETLDEERPVVLNEFDRDRSDPVYRLQLQVEQHLWGDAWGRKNPLGEADAISKATPRLLRDIYRRYYVPNNAAVVVSGDITPKQVFTEAQRRFGSWNRMPDPFTEHPVPATPSLARSAPVVIDDDVQEVTVRIEWQGPSASHDLTDTYAADVLGSIVNDPGSTFHRHLVDSGLFASVGLSYLTLNHVGPITLFATTTIDSLPHALTALRRELGNLDEVDAFSDDELTNSKQARAVDAALELDHPTGVAHTVAYWWSIAGLGYYRTYTADMARVTRVDLQRYARRYISESPAIVGVLVPRGTRATAEPAIERFVRDLAAPRRVVPVSQP
jgi:zinc protease